MKVIQPAAGLAMALSFSPAVTKTAPFVVVSASHSTPPSTKTLIRMQ